MTLADDVRAILNECPGTFGVYAGHLGTDETVAINAERVLPTERAANTFVLVHYARLVLPRRLPHAYQSVDFDFLMPVRAFNKTGGGLGTCVDSGRFETDHAAWIVAASATEQTDFASRADDAAPTAFAEIGEVLYERWGAT